MECVHDCIIVATNHCSGKQNYRDLPTIIIKCTLCCRFIDPNCGLLYYSLRGALDYGRCSKCIWTPLPEEHSLRASNRFLRHI